MEEEEEKEDLNGSDETCLKPVIHKPCDFAIKHTDQNPVFIFF